MSGVDCVSRLQRDLRDWLQDPIENVAAEPLQSNLREWHVNLLPTDGPYRDVLTHLVLRFPESYPHDPPKALLCTNLPGHPNVFMDWGRWYDTAWPLDYGYICLDMLRSSTEKGQGWSAAYSVRSVLMQLYGFLMMDCNIDQDHGGRSRVRLSSDKLGKCKREAQAFTCRVCGHTGTQPWPAVIQSSTSAQHKRAVLPKAGPQGKALSPWGRSSRSTSGAADQLRYEGVVVGEVCAPGCHQTGSAAQLPTSAACTTNATCSSKAAVTPCTSHSHAARPAPAAAAAAQPLPTAAATISSSNHHQTRSHSSQQPSLMNSVNDQEAAQLPLYLDLLDDAVLHKVLQLLPPEDLSRCQQVDRRVADCARHVLREKELVCYFSKLGFKQAVLGYGISRKWHLSSSAHRSSSTAARMPSRSHPSQPHSQLRSLHSPMELLSFPAFQAGLRTSVWNEPFEKFLPLYLNPAHGERALALLPACIRAILDRNSSTQAPIYIPPPPAAPRAVRRPAASSSSQAARSGGSTQAGSSREAVAAQPHVAGGYAAIRESGRGPLLGGVPPRSHRHNSRPSHMDFVFAMGLLLGQEGEDMADGGQAEGEGEQLAATDAGQQEQDTAAGSQEVSAGEGQQQQAGQPQAAAARQQQGTSQAPSTAASTALATTEASTASTAARDAASQLAEEGWQQVVRRRPSRPQSGSRMGGTTAANAAVARRLAPPSALQVHSNEVLLVVSQLLNSLVVDMVGEASVGVHRVRDLSVSSAAARQFLQEQARNQGWSHGSTLSRGMCDASLSAFCHLHHLLLALTQQPGSSVAEDAQAAVQAFLACPANRHKARCPDLGLLLVQYLITPKSMVSWGEFAPALVREALARHVLWAVRRDDRHRRFGAPDMDQHREEGDKERLRSHFLAASTSLRLLMLQAWFANAVARPASPADLARIKAEYDLGLGQPPAATFEAFGRYARQVLRCSNWVQFLQGMRLGINTRLAPQQAVVHMLRQAVVDSLNCGYHQQGSSKQQWDLKRMVFMDWDRQQPVGVCQGGWV